MSPVGRYRVDGPLGCGGMGAVFRTYDAVLERTVALKRAHECRAADLLRFKREFRAIERLTHPNLVRLYELGSDAEGLYYTMEAIDGDDLARYCAGPNIDERLSRALPQLLSALSFLHANKVLHCDLKPSNVLVDRSGVVKLLDFGVLATIASGERSTLDSLAGTPGYLAPERIAGAAPSPASDAYALGCTMFEILTGALPFVGHTPAVLYRHRYEEPPRPSMRGADVSPLLDSICYGLLAKDPRERLTLEQVGRALSTHTSGVDLRCEVLLGRSDLQAALAAALDEDQRPIVLVGPTGVGKSALLAWLANEAERRGLLVLRSASRSTERLAYNALDAAMDELARVLMRTNAPDVDRRAQHIAAEAFPVLRVRPRAMEEAREQARLGIFGWRDDLEAGSRREVFDAVAALLDRATGERGGMLTIDDFQWADDDSLALLRHLLEHTRPSLRVVLVARDDVEATAAHAWLASDVGVRTIVVPPLAQDEVHTLVRHVLASHGAHASDAAIASAARASHGRPFLAEVAARSLARGSDGSLEDVVARVWPKHGDLLAVLVADDGWTPMRMLSHVLARPLGVTEEALRELAAEGLVRQSGYGLKSGVDLYHDGVRTLASLHVHASERVRLHGRIADYLLEDDEAPAHKLVRHLVAADRIDEAAAHARRGAQAAERQRAFGLAAEMYAIALRRASEDRELREARARALEQSSRYKDAASEWATLARDATGTQHLDLALREAHALIAANRTSDGMRRLESALAKSGQGALRVRGIRAITTAARFLVGPIARAGARRSTPSLRAGAERDLKIGILLAYLDPLTGISFLQRARSELLKAGAEAQVVGCDYLFAILALAGSRRVDRVPLAERYVRAARERTRGLALPPDVRGMAPFAEGVGLLRRARWSEAGARFAEAGTIFSESAGTTEVDMTRSWRMMMAAHMQDLPAMREHVEWFRRHADEYGGTIMVVHLALVGGYKHLLEGRFDDAFDTLTEGANLFEPDPPNAQRAALLLYRWCADVYRDDGRRARREVMRELARAKQFRFLTTMYAGNYAMVLGLIEANALRSGDKDASARRIEHYARIVDTSPPLWSGGSWRLRAYAADALAKPELALTHLVRAEQDAEEHGRSIDAAIARWQRGRRLGGDEGAALQKSALAIVSSAGASSQVLEEDAGTR